MSDLNLLPSEAKFQAERMRLKALIANFLWVFGGFWLILIIIVLGWNLISQLNLNYLNKKYNKVVKKYESLVGNMAINQKVRYQAKVVAKVLDDRFEYGESIEKIQNIFSKKIVLDNYEINEKKKFVIYGSIADGSNLVEVEDKVDDINWGRIEGFKTANLVNVGVNKNKGWNFTMEVTLE